MFFLNIHYVIILLFGTIIFDRHSLYGLSPDSSRKLTIGILRHLGIEEAAKASLDTYAERSLLAEGQRRGYDIHFINPTEPLSTRSCTQFDAIISRAEVDEFTDPMTDAYLRALDYFQTNNIPVINNVHSLIYAQDKFRTLLLAQKMGITIPLTFLVYRLDDIHQLMMKRDICFPFFLKKPYSGCGKGVFLVNDEQRLLKIMGEHFSIGEPILAEERVDLETDEHGNVRDMRIWVVRDSQTGEPHFVGGVYRNASNGHYLTNVHAGGSVSPLEKPYAQDLVVFAERALESIGADVAGIDIARDKQGKLYLIEINISFFTSELVTNTIGINIWQLVMDLVEARVCQNHMQMNP